MSSSASADADAFASLVQHFRSSHDSATHPWLDFVLPDTWTLPEREAEFWRSAAEAGVFELQMALASCMLEKLLVQNHYMRSRRFARWPSRDRHQLWATLWLALRFWPDRRYSAAEVEEEMTRLLITPDPAIAFALQADLVRRDLVERDEATGHMLASRRHILFLLDGDKMFALRAAVISDRPWWLLALNTQFATAPQAEPSVVPTGRAFRVVLLEEPSTKASTEASTGDGSSKRSPVDELAQLSCKFVTSAGAPVDASPLPSLVADEHGTPAFCALVCAFDAPTTCLEVRVSTTARLPPFRVEVRADDAADGDGDGEDGTSAAWRLLQCQPMPTADELCNSGRDGARCFLPRAVPVVTGARVDALAAEKPLAELLEGGVVKRWPSKQKQQAALVTWLARHLLPARRYAEGEIDWLIATRFTRAVVPDCPTIRKEFERRGLVEREAGGGGFVVKADADEGGVEPGLVAIE